MPTRLGPRWPIDFSGRPQQMAVEDLEIWNRWWRLNQGGAVALYFDIGLGEGKPVGPDATPAETRMWLHNTQKRADVIVERADHIELIELRNAASPNAIGRLLQYKMLYLQDPVLGEDLQLMLVTNFRDGDVEALSSANNITYSVV